MMYTERTNRVEIPYCPIGYDGMFAVSVIPVEINYRDTTDIVVGKIKKMRMSTIEDIALTALVENAKSFKWLKVNRYNTTVTELGYVETVIINEAYATRLTVSNLLLEISKDDLERTLTWLGLLGIRCEPRGINGHDTEKILNNIINPTELPISPWD